MLFDDYRIFSPNFPLKPEISAMHSDACKPTAAQVWEHLEMDPFAREKIEENLGSLVIKLCRKETQSEEKIPT